MSELSQAIQEMRNMRESYDQIGAAAEAYNTGKTELAANITAKGVQASATETLPELADKVAAIAQESYTIDGGEMYVAQQFGDGALWNLYQVLADMKTRFMGTGDYAALIVCEYYKGYDSLQLQGADAYYTCDGDFYDVLSPLHTWHDSDNGKANRWVCFLFATEGARLDITNTAISPRSMYIGGHIGTIEYFVNGRLTEFVGGVEETDVVDYLLFNGHTQAFGFNCTLKGITNYGIFDNKTISSGGCVSLDIKDISIGDGTYPGPKLNIPNANAIAITTAHYRSSRFSGLSIGASVTDVIIKAPIVSLPGAGGESAYLLFGTLTGLQHIDMRDTSIIEISLSQILRQGAANLIDLYVGELTTNIPISYWNPTNVLADADKKAQLIENIKNHILARVSDATDGTQLVFYISTNMYNAIASENITWNDQTMTLADAFLTKNWLLAGA